MQEPNFSQLIRFYPSVNRKNQNIQHSPTNSAQPNINHRCINPSPQCHRLPSPKAAGRQPHPAAPPSVPSSALLTTTKTILEGNSKCPSETDTKSARFYYSHILTETDNFYLWKRLYLSTSQIDLRRWTFKTPPQKIIDFRRQLSSGARLCKSIFRGGHLKGPPSKKPRPKEARKPFCRVHMYITTWDLEPLISLLLFPISPSLLRRCPDRRHA